MASPFSCAFPVHTPQTDLSMNIIVSMSTHTDLFKSHLFLLHMYSAC